MKTLVFTILPLTASLSIWAAEPKTSLLAPPQAAFQRAQAQINSTNAIPAAETDGVKPVPAVPLPSGELARSVRHLDPDVLRVLPVAVDPELTDLDLAEQDDSIARMEAKALELEATGKQPRSGWLREHVLRSQSSQDRKARQAALPTESPEAWRGQRLLLERLLGRASSMEQAKAAEVDALEQDMIFLQSESVIAHPGFRPITSENPSKPVKLHALSQLLTTRRAEARQVKAEAEFLRSELARLSTLEESSSHNSK